MDAYEVNERANDLPYGVEYSKSGRSSCRHCRNYIGDRAIRMSAREPSRFFDGIQDNWFHLDCFFNKLGRGHDRINERSIRGLENLKWDDQEKIRERIKLAETSVPVTQQNVYAQYKIEISKSNRAKCSKCSTCFEKGELKIGFKSSWYHQACIFESKLYSDEITKLKGFQDLPAEIQEELKAKYKKHKKKESQKLKKSAVVEEAPIQTEAADKLATANEDSEDDGIPKMKKFCFNSVETTPEEVLKQQLKKQTDLMWEIREYLNQLDHESVCDILDYNGQLNDVLRKRTKDNLLEHLIDCASFGKPVRCEQCPSGLLVFSLSQRTYACIGYVSEYTRCINVNQNPLRTPFNIPSRIYEKHAFLKSVRFNILPKRIYPGENEEIVQRRDSSYFKNLGARSATETFMEGIKKGIDAFGQSKKIIKNGTVVDGEFEHAAECYVYKEEEGNFYSVTLHQTDVIMNTNSYYKMQLLKHDFKEIYFVFRSWGRIGTNRGGVVVDRFTSPKQAISSFENVFFEKSGNKWENRKYFIKKAGCFMLVETDYSELEKVKDNHIVPGTSTQLHRAIKEIILMISNINDINKSLNELQLDTKKMPLGKLSKQTLTNAHALLNEVSALLQNNGSRAQIIDATNRFYTLVPHDFGLENAKVLDNNEIIKKKCEMIDSLIDFQFAYDFLKQGDDAASITNRDPVDIHYEKLKCTMEYVEPSSQEYTDIKRYIKNSHGRTHSHYSLSIIDILKLKRSGEEEKFTKQIGNRKLLWHGSRVGNFVGILSQGLRIAPPEAPVSGYMFGKGVYFADLVSKSANYCGVMHGEQEGLLLLCDVALGKEQIEFHAKNIKKPDTGYHSVKGCGQYIPASSVYTHPDGYTIAYNGLTTVSQPNAQQQPGNQPPIQQQYSLLYNEYIVYDVNQIQLKYLLRVNFKGK